MTEEKAEQLRQEIVRLLPQMTDPAAGTGNFLRAAGWHAIGHHVSRGGDPREIVRDHLLPHFH